MWSHRWNDSPHGSDWRTGDWGPGPVIGVIVLVVGGVALASLEPVQPILDVVIGALLTGVACLLATGAWALAFWLATVLAGLPADTDDWGNDHRGNTVGAFLLGVAALAGGAAAFASPILTTSFDVGWDSLRPVFWVSLVVGLVGVLVGGFVRGFGILRALLVLAAVGWLGRDYLPEGMLPPGPGEPSDGDGDGDGDDDEYARVEVMITCVRGGRPASCIYPIDATLELPSTPPETVARRRALPSWQTTRHVHFDGLDPSSDLQLSLTVWGGDTWRQALGSLSAAQLLVVDVELSLE